ncbi:MAG: phosphatidylserine/phosphatidylglycerophosphate/cardiolipin synthase family protein [Myxococcota bacterium]
MTTTPRPPAAARASYPRRPGNEVVPWLEGGPAFARIVAAVDAAEHSVWVTVAFIERDVVLPGGRSFFDVIDAAAARGVDVRVLFWREPQLQALDPGSTHFGGDATDRAFLRSRQSRIRVRWDRLPGGFAQHQKSWLLDAGTGSELCFVGGLNPTSSSMSDPEYTALDAGNVHDCCLEIRGPATTDVHHNFVQRWNEASDGQAEDGHWPEGEPAGPLTFPDFVTPPAGDVAVQITRTVRAGTYRDDTASPGAKPFAIAEGEQSALEQYVSAVASAERTLYIENQAIASPIFVEEMQQALARGVRVVCLVPGRAHPAFVMARRDPRATPFFEQLAGLARFEHFTLAALCQTRAPGRYDEIGIHAKVAIVDDEWASVGSTNVAERSFRHDTELNAAFWHPVQARGLRESLFANALGASVAGDGEVAAFDRFRDVARANLDRRTLWEPLEGRAYALDPAQYGA